LPTITVFREERVVNADYSGAFDSTFKGDILASKKIKGDATICLLHHHNNPNDLELYQFNTSPHLPLIVKYKGIFDLKFVFSAL
jgi:hypothetical protein